MFAGELRCEKTPRQETARRGREGQRGATVCASTDSRGLRNVREARRDEHPIRNGRCASWCSTSSSTAPSRAYKMWLPRDTDRTAA